MKTRTAIAGCIILRSATTRKTSPNPNFSNISTRPPCGRAGCLKKEENDDYA